jgi:hypothetical protein
MVEKFIDKSGDKKYFTVVPNMIVNGFNAIENGVYLYIKRRAGETGQFFETQENACKKMSINLKTFRKILKKFVAEGTIKHIGWKKFKTHPIKVYEVIDVWEKNKNNYKSNGENRPISSQKKEVMGKIDPLVMGKIDLQKKNPIEEEPTTDTTTVVSVSKAHPKFGDPLVNEAIKYFESIHPTVKRLKKIVLNRNTAYRMLKKLGLPKLKRTIAYAVQIRTLPYSPQIYNFMDLEEKMPKLLDFYQRQKKKGVVEI